MGRLPASACHSRHVPPGRRTTVKSQRNRPARRRSDLDLESLVERAHLLGDQGRQTTAELKAIRTRLEAGRAQAEQALLRAGAALQIATDRLRAIRAPGG